ncbi:MAG: hypothetical protein AAGO57_01645 [Pseudomonadota bacterium]
MTALDAYQRLEASGVWRPGPSEQRINVVVSSGSATLTITDMSDRALAHWSLPAIDRVNPGAEPAIYRPAPDAADRLEIADSEMIAAIEQVRRAVTAGQPKPGRLRSGILTALVIGLMGLVVFWAPDALRNQAAAILPEAARDGLGRDVFTKIQKITGSPCSEPRGQEALNQLAQRYAPGTTVWVMPSAIESSATLPGNTILLGRSVVEDHETPFVAAGYLVEADLSRQLRDPIVDLLSDATIVEAGRLVTTGRLSERALTAHAERRAQSPARSPDQGDLVARFAALDLPSEPFAYAKDISGETVLGLIEAGSIPISEARPALTDSAWVALQGICGE